MGSERDLLPLIAAEAMPHLEFSKPREVAAALATVSCGLDPSVLGDGVGRGITGPDVR